ncbi:MAG: cardiolipin synthase [Victivallales bacterium]|nr:cardiolipin synthase [Victivallales bacterium]
MTVNFFLFFYSADLFKLWLVFFIICLLLDITTIIHILKNKHYEPASAILWIFVVVDLHLIGVLLYLLLGINRLKTKGIKIEQHNQTMDALKGPKGYLSNFLERLIDFHETYNDKPHEYQHIFNKIIAGTFPIKGNKVELLVDGTTVYPKMLKEIKNAKRHINLQSYIINNDEVGQEIFHALSEKAKEGVKVKVLFDALGSSKAYKSHFFKHWILQKNPNFKIKAFSKLNLFTPYRIQLRNHRKLLICDGKTAFVGGINISSENDINYTLKNRHIHDLHCRLEGPTVGELQFNFLKDWSFVTRKDPITLLTETNYFVNPEYCGNAVIRTLPSGPGQSYEATKKMFMTAAVSAKKHLWIITPYFVPEASFIQSLCMLAAKDVDIRVIIPQNNNHWYVRYACRSIYNRLIASNIKIFEKTGNFSHVKAMIVDNKWAAMGSSNCDVRSFRLNYELDCVIEDSEFVEKLHRQFLKEMEESIEITWHDRKARGQLEKLLENVCSLFTPVM